MSRFVVGIDLGTTNSALAYSATGESAADGCNPARSNAADPAGRGPERSLRASRSCPRSSTCRRRENFPAGALDLPWKSPPEPGGTFAREHGAKVTGRLVGSAKSWLSHPGVDRRGPILPWTAAEDVAQGLAGHGFGRLSGAPPRRLELPVGGEEGRRPTGEPGRSV